MNNYFVENITPINVDQRVSGIRILYRLTLILIIQSNEDMGRMTSRIRE